MDLDTFEDWAREECLFIGSLMEKEGVMAILKNCLRYGEEEIREKAGYYPEVTEQFFHTPRPRRSKLLGSIGDTEDLHAVLVVLLHEARSSLMLLEALCKYGVSAGAIGSKSMMIGQSAAALHAVAAGRPSLFPFAEDLPFGMSLEWFGLEEEQAGDQGVRPSARTSLARSQGSRTRKPRRDRLAIGPDEEQLSPSGDE